MGTKLQTLFLTIVKLGVILILVMAVTTKHFENNNYILRWIITITFSYFFILSFLERHLFLTLFYIITVVLFNPLYKLIYVPFLPFLSHLYIWNLIIFLIAAITAISIIYDWRFETKPI